jgi:LDH2 family malate/lactate/ureidoglycolate dehydrogenase
LSNLSGVDTHGVFHLPRYVSEIRDGLLVPTEWPKIVTETPTTALVTGNWTFGHVVAKYAMDLAVDKARDQNVAVVSFVRALHIGRLGEYSELAASQGMVGTVWASGYGEEEPVAVPFGGRAPVLHTNPISMGFPGGDEPSMVLDFATTTIAGSKVRIAQLKGEQVPLGSLVDKEGNPTTDPSGYPVGGGMLPFGGHKGYAIMLADELMGRVLSGSDAHAEAHRGGPITRHQGVTMIVLKADLFQPLAEFTRRADELGRRIRAVPPAAGFDEVLVPGDPEKRSRAERRRDGIPIPEEVWRSLTDLAADLDVAVPDVKMDDS